MTALTSSRSILRSTQALIFLLLLTAAMLAKADSLVSVSTDSLLQLPVADPVSRVFVVENRPVALGVEATWLLDESEQTWERVSWRPQAQVLGVAGDGAQAFLLLGSENDVLVSRVEMVSLSTGTLQSSVLPLLPVPLVSAEGALLQEQLFIIGTTAGGAQQLLSINPLSEQRTWISHAAWPGNSGSVRSVVAQNTVLLTTITDQAGTGERMLQWSQTDGWVERSALSGAVVAGSGRAIGQGHVIYLVAGDPKPRLMSFNTITGSWAVHGNVDAAAISSGTGWKDGVLWVRASSESAGSNFAYTTIESGQLLLKPLDWAVIAVYLMGMLGIGLYFYSRNAQKSEAEFFLGGRSIPFWAAGISLYVSNASSISYIAVPAKAFATNWQYLLSNMIVVVGLMFVAVWVVPLLRRLDLMSIFHYLETRFHPGIRVLSSALYIVFQLAGRMTIILFLPSLAISTVTGIDVALSVLIMGGVTVCYTVLGGMKAVIWTDFLQLFVMFGGVFFAIAFIVLQLDGGVSEFLSIASLDGKMKMVDWSFNLTDATIWGFMFLVLFDTVLTFPKDQVLMQRILSTESAKDAGRSVWTFAIVVLPASILFFLIGTALYVFYQTHPERMDPSLTIDATFPLFIAAELPIGVTGLIIAGIFAASMSTLSSILNSVATLATVDFYEKIVRNPIPKKSLRFAEATTVVSGLIGIGLALLLSRYEIHSLLDLALELWGLLGGGFAGAYTLGMFTRRSNWQGVAIGVAISITVTLYLWLGNMVHPYFYLPVSVFICIVTGYTASWFFPAPTTLQGLTVFDEDVTAGSPAS